MQGPTAQATESFESFEDKKHFKNQGNELQSQTYVVIQYAACTWNMYTLNKNKKYLLRQEVVLQDKQDKKFHLEQNFIPV